MLFIAVLAYGYVFSGWFTKKRSIDEHVDFVSPHFVFRAPHGPEVFPPAVVIVPGCLGTNPYHATWSEFFVSQGWATLTVDSFSPRGLHKPSALQRVCDGSRPWGFERAADIIAAVKHLEQMPGVGEDKIVLAGWGHGGWAVMDALSFGETSRSTNLTGFSPDWAAGVQGVVLFDPYCGFGSRSKEYGWQVDADVLMFLSDADQSHEAGLCMRTGKKLIADGHIVNVIMFGHASHPDDSDTAAPISYFRNDALMAPRARAYVATLLQSISTNSQNKGE